MPDFCDMGHEAEEMARKAALSMAGTRRADAPSRETCAECGAPIPEARRAAVPGVTMCVACQAAAEGA